MTDCTTDSKHTVAVKKQRRSVSRWVCADLELESNTFTLQLSTTDNLPLADNLSSVTEEADGGRRDGQMSALGSKRSQRSEKQTPPESISYSIDTH